MTHWEQLTGRTMQKKIITLLIPFLGFPLFAQETNPDKEKLLKELAENACQCIDSVDTYNRPKDEINEDVNECILKQTDVYMLSAQLMNAVDLNKAVEGENGNKEIKVELNLNRDSKVFKEYYYEMERYLMKNCPELKSKVASNDEHNKYSVSKNPEALRIYDEGIELMKKEKYEKPMIISVYVTGNSVTLIKPLKVIKSRSNWILMVFFHGKIWPWPTSTRRIIIRQLNVMRD
jgi:hypothetical protein